jgi:GT2 family glycosyltransferase
VPIDAEVLIVSYNSAEFLSRCLPTIAAAMPGVPVAIREHGSDPVALAALEGVIAVGTPPVRLEYDAGNPGFGAGCNALAAGSRAEWLVFLNPDTEVIAWIEQSPPDRAIVGATMVDSGPPGDHSGRSYRFVDEVARSWMRRRGSAPDGRGFVSGAALMIQRECFEELRGFDPGYFLFYEDIDLCLRANAAGIRTVVSPEWRVRHARRHSTDARFAEAIAWSYESGCRFHRDYGTPVGVYRTYVAIDSLARSVVHRVRRDRARSSAYLALARRACHELLSRTRLGDR